MSVVAAHNHCHCAHEHLKFCAQCNVVWCADCGKEWREQVVAWHGTGATWTYPAKPSEWKYTCSSDCTHNG